MIIPSTYQRQQPMYIPVFTRALYMLFHSIVRSTTVFLLLIIPYMAYLYMHNVLTSEILFYGWCTWHDCVVARLDNNI